VKKTAKGNAAWSTRYGIGHTHVTCRRSGCASAAMIFVSRRLSGARMTTAKTAWL